jgi:hypothetical protein
MIVEIPEGNGKLRVVSEAIDVDDNEESEPGVAPNALPAPIY